MRIFFVRHAKSKLNHTNVHQRPSTPLSAEGLRQARTVARKLKRVHAQLILCSEYARAVGTAKIISKETGLKIVYTPLLNENKSPSELIGKRRAGAEARRIRAIREAHAGDRRWHYSDEENFFDLRKRALAFLSYAKRTRKHTVIAVTHGMFLSAVVGIALFGKGMNSEQHMRLNRIARVGNTGISELEIDGRGHMRLHTLNDYSHLR
ncbi:MAG: histidine phosphatase family protein [Candidatus Marsarchaeota archaeon]|nr:histidine phosphatase family protein [Candidatus Marsarchaeota archaeon]